MMALRVYRPNGFSAPTRVPGGLEGAELFPTQVSLLSSVGALPLLLQFQASLLPLPLSGVLPSGTSPSVASAPLQLPLPGLLPLSWVTCSLPEASTTPACPSPCCAEHRRQPDQHGTGHQTVKSMATITPRISTAHCNFPQCNQAILACVWWRGQGGLQPTLSTYQAEVPMSWRRLCRPPVTPWFIFSCVFWVEFINAEAKTGLVSME